MSYVDTKEGGSTRLVTGGVVGALQVALAVVIVSGFGVIQFESKKEQPLASQFFPTAPLPPEPVDTPEIKDAPEEAIASSQVTAPETLVRLPAPDSVEVPVTIRDTLFTNPVAVPSVSVPPVARSEPAPQFVPRSASPRGDVARWVTTSDYPGRELRSGHEGLVRFRLTIDTRGRVSECAILESSGYPGLDEATCKYASKRGRFDPATDGTGKSATGSWSSAVRWVIPKD